MGQIDGFLARGQLWLVGLALFLVMLLSAQGGAALRKRLARPTGDAEAAEGYLLSATLALLGLLIAFTFSLAISRFDARRQLVVNEANAIGTAWLRAGLASSPQDDALQRAIAGDFSSFFTLEKSSAKQPQHKRPSGTRSARPLPRHRLHSSIPR